VREVRGSDEGNGDNWLVEWSIVRWCLVYSRVDLLLLVSCKVYLYSFCLLFHLLSLHLGIFLSSFIILFNIRQINRVGSFELQAPCLGHPVEESMGRDVAREVNCLNLTFIGTRFRKCIHHNHL